MWYVIQALKGKESKVAETVVREVADKGENVFVFEYEKEYRIKGEWIKERKPFFPGYIFADVEKNIAEDFDRRLRKNKQKLMEVDGMITPIRPEEQEYLMKLGGEEHVIHHSEGFRVDDYVVITSGPFIGYNGEIRKIDRHHRSAVICMTLLGRDMEVEINLEILERKTFQELVADDENDRLNMAKIVRD
ncbi:transcription termination/antitermination NusG family protein [Butyrivibrio sp. NC3005]|uniref:transcription termination/antitermination NusG family protein n=1 Tax=Butyrivibrio sp. NC3005 TaxID=1280685 RepID=UPI000428ACF7|nr:transcription termination/antitermination NusG family protein [Butyrivibrio sp. NC3005]